MLRGKTGRWPSVTPAGGDPSPSWPPTGTSCRNAQNQTRLVSSWKHLNTHQRSTGSGWICVLLVSTRKWKEWPLQGALRLAPSCGQKGELPLKWPQTFSVKTLDLLFFSPTEQLFLSFGCKFHSCISENDTFSPVFISSRQIPLLGLNDWTATKLAHLNCTVHFLLISLFYLQFLAAASLSLHLSSKYCMTFSLHSALFPPLFYSSNGLCCFTCPPPGTPMSLIVLACFLSVFFSLYLSLFVCISSTLHLFFLSHPHFLPPARLCQGLGKWSVRWVHF